MVRNESSIPVSDSNAGLASLLAKFLPNWLRALLLQSDTPLISLSFQFPSRRSAICNLRASGNAVFLAIASNLISIEPVVNFNASNVSRAMNKCLYCSSIDFFIYAVALVRRNAVLNIVWVRISLSNVEDTA